MSAPEFVGTVEGWADACSPLGYALPCRTCAGTGRLETTCDPLTCRDGWSCAGGCVLAVETCPRCEGAGFVEEV